MGWRAAGGIVAGEWVRAERNDRGSRYMSAGGGGACCELSPTDKREYSKRRQRRRVTRVYVWGIPGRQRRKTGNVCVTWRRTGRNITTRRRWRRRRGRRFTPAAGVRVCACRGFTTHTECPSKRVRFNHCYPPSPLPTNNNDKRARTNRNVTEQQLRFLRFTHSPSSEKKPKWQEKPSKSLRKTTTFCPQCLLQYIILMWWKNDK